MPRAFGGETESAVQRERRTLLMRFGSARAFMGEYERNLVRGGLVVPTRDSFELRELIRVRLELEGCAEALTLDAEVVHLLDSHAGGGHPGVAVEFQMATAALRDAMAPLLAAAFGREEREAEEASAMFGDVGTDLSDAPGQVSAGHGAAADLVVQGAPELSTPEEAGELRPQDDTLELGPELEVEPEPAEPAELALDEADALPSAAPVAASLPAGADPVLELGPELTLDIEVEPEPASALPQGTRPLLVDTRDTRGRVRVRNLSTTGALVVTESAPIPVGDAVILRLARVGSEAPLDVAGKVVHHFESDGATTAMGVQFDAPEDQRALLIECAEAHEAAAQARRMGGIAGPIEQVGLANLLQMLGSCSKIGTLELTSGTREGSIAFEDGTLRHARVGCVSGPKAIARMLAWGEGSFEFHPGIDHNEADDLAMGLDGALFEAVRQLDELEHIDRRAMPPTASLVVVAERADAERGELEKTEEAVLDLAQVGFKIQRIADVVPVPDAEIYGALAALLDRGLVQIPG